MLFDTNFLIAYGKGTKAVSKQRARSYFAALPPGTPCFIARVTWMEFVAGFESEAAAAPHLAPFTVLDMDTQLWWAASRVVRNLGLRGKPIGSADSIIAATALTYGLPVVSNNTRHFRDVEGLDLRDY